MATTAPPQPLQLQYHVVEGWEQLPAGFTHRDCVGVSTDSQDNVYLFTRMQPRVIVYQREGSFVRSWGEDLFTERTHGITVGPNDEVYCIDEGSHCIYKFGPDGDLQLTIGTKGQASDTGYDGSLESIRGGPPFNRPTNLAVAPNGELYVSDGYGNARVHRYSAKGELMQSFGEPGTGPGQVNLPHGVAVASDGRVVLADRENDRLQFFTPDGEYLEEWTNVQRPTNVVLDAAGNVYVSELWWRIGQRRMRFGEVTDDMPARVSVFRPDGTLLARWGGPDREAAGNFIAPHDLAVDSHGDVYVAEVTHTFAGRLGLVHPESHTFQKFTRV